MFRKLRRALHYSLAVPIAIGAQVNGHRLAWRSQLPLVGLAAKVLNRDPFVIADQDFVLRGYPLAWLEGAEKMTAILRDFREKGTGVLFVANHFHRCPLGVGGNAIALFHALRYNAQKAVPQNEIKHPYVAIGLGRRAVISGLVDRLEACCHSFAVGRNTGGSEKIQTLLRAGEWVLNYLESTNSDELSKGSKGGGISVYLAAQQGAAIVPTAVWFEKDKVFVDLGEPLDRETILSLGRRDHTIDGEAVADFAMRQGIKPLLPSRLWGVYGPTR